MSQSLKALPVGRFLRFLLGAFLGVTVWPFFGSAALNRILGVVLVVVGLTLFYAALHWLVSTSLTKLNRCLGAAFAILPVFLVFLLGGALG